MAYTEKFQKLADAAMARVEGVAPGNVDQLLKRGAVILDIRDKEEHDADHIAGSLHVSRGKLEMNIEGVVQDLDTVILCYCNANNRGALSGTRAGWFESTIRSNFGVTSPCPSSYFLLAPPTPS